MSETRTYAINSQLDLVELGASLEQYLATTQNLKTQRFDMENRIVVQSAGDNTQWTKFIGMDAAITAELTLEGDVLSVTVGSAKWMDKMGVALAGIAFAPLLITAGLGALRQSALPELIFDFVEGKLLNRSSVHEQAVQPSCPNCGKAVAINDAFCSNCGQKL